jgi:colanic acid/amylovoran biosynthesis glycosyltransferase
VAPHAPDPAPAVLQRCDAFVGRTMNWIYDHLCHVPRHAPIVLCHQLQNRREFPRLEARSRHPERFSRRLWRRLSGNRIYPGDARWLRRFQPALLHSHFGYVAVGDHDLRAYLDVPWLVGFYGADAYELGREADWQDRYAHLFAQADLILALGPRMASELELLGCPEAKLAVHPLGVPVDSIPQRPRVLEPGATLEILFAGTFREKKGIEYVIRAAAEARRHGVRLHVTLVGDAAGKPGDAATKEALFREVDRLHLGEAVTHRSFVEFADLIQMALGSHVFAAPSVTGANGDAEGTPFLLQQMMATAMPVIATDHSDIPYIFGEHRDLLVPERDADAIATRLQEYADEPDRLVSDGLAMRQRIQSAFDVRACAARLSDLYDGLLRG